MQPLEKKNSFLENKIHDVTSLLNTITITTETENTFNEKSDCQEAFNELGNVNHCIDNLIDSDAIDH